MSDIPPEIIQHILSRLPVKSLLRFRCVSKSWCSLIDSKHFIRLHLNHSCETYTNRNLVVESSSPQLFYIDLDSYENLDIGYTRFDTDSFVGCCNGLVLIVSDIDDVVLWNPATRKQNKLPTTPLECSISYEVSFAFGHDSKQDDYKVVRVVLSNEKVHNLSLCLEAKIFSLKTNSWKRVESFPYMLPDDRRWGIYLNDALHTVLEHNSEVIMAFHLGKEDHFKVPLPEFSKDCCGLASVEVMGGCLTAFATGKSNSEIWLMKEYGVKESWIKLLCFDHPIPGLCINLYPLVFSKKGDKILVNYVGRCLPWCDLSKKTVPLTFKCCGSCLIALFEGMGLEPPFAAGVCVGSLVSPCSRVGVAAEKHKGKEIKKERDDFLSVGFKLKV